MQGSKLYVGNLTYAVTDDQLREIFSPHGEVISANVIPGKGFGFVEMGSPEAAEAAKTALNGQDFSGRSLRIDEARPPKPKTGGGGFGGGGGGGGGGPRRSGGGRRDFGPREGY